jgi:molecular chaperone GrpE
MADEMNENAEQDAVNSQSEHPDGASVEIGETRDPLEALADKIEQLEDKNLRLVAELRNVQQRAQRDQREALRFADADFARDLLAVIDNLERTLESARQSDETSPVVEGVRITYDHLMKILQARHIEPIAAEGAPFNPDVHEAMMQQPSDEHDAGTILRELARGYKMHERVLRSSKVIVSSGRAEDAQE